MTARILCAITTASLVACGGGGQQQQTSNTQGGGEPQTREVAVARPGCSYITEAEATEALGQPSKYRSYDSTSTVCVIDPASGQMMNAASVDFTVSWDQATMYDYYTRQEGSEQVAGLGDRAVMKAGSSQVQLVAIKGNNAVMLTLTDMRPRRDVKGMARAFAEKVLARM